MAKSISRDQSTAATQHVIHNDQTRFAHKPAYFVVVPADRQTGVYDEVDTVQEHQELVDHFTDASVFAD